MFCRLGILSILDHARTLWGRCAWAHSQSLRENEPLSTRRPGCAGSEETGGVEVKIPQAGRPDQRHSGAGYC